MRILTGDTPLPAGLRGAAVVIGNFDGVHRGHQALVEVAHAEAGGRAGRVGLVTFEPHPRSFFRPEEPVFRLSPLPLKARLAGALGVEFVVALTFDKALAALEAEAFVHEVLVRRLGVSHVVTGHDFHFGHGRKGNADTLRQLGGALGFAVSVVEQVTDKGGLSPFSSSDIRAALRHGNVEAAGRQLGYWWTVLGTVVEGDRRGRLIGFPTANLVLPPGTEPREGIYAARVRLDGRGPALPGAAYIGTRPTFATNRSFLEVHLLDFEGDLYGRELMVDLVSYLRPDQTFDGVEPLKRQMREDCASAARALELLAKDDPLVRFPLGRLQSEGRL